MPCHHGGRHGGRRDELQRKERVRCVSGVRFWERRCRNRESTEREEHWATEAQHACANRERGNGPREQACGCSTRPLSSCVLTACGLWCDARGTVCVPAPPGVFLPGTSRRPREAETGKGLPAPCVTSLSVVRMCVTSALSETCGNSGATHDFSVANASAARGQIWKSADTAAQPSQAAGGSKAACS